MRRASLYSSSNRSRNAARTTSPSGPLPPGGGEGEGAPRDGAAPSETVKPPGRFARLRNAARRSERLLMLGAGALIAVAIVYGNGLLHPQSRELTQDDIDGAVM